VSGATADFEDRLQDTFRRSADGDAFGLSQSGVVIRACEVARQ
jgi:hypothetical protein